MIREFLKQNVLPFLVGLGLMAAAIAYTDALRNGNASGGELLVLPVVVLFVELVREVRESGALDILFSDADDDEDAEDDDDDI